MPITLAPGVRLFVLLALYALASVASLFFSYLLRFDFEIPTNYFEQARTVILWVLPLKLLLLAAFGQFRSLLSFFSFPDAKRLVLAMGIAALIMLGVWYLISPRYAPPRSVIVTDFLTLLFFLYGIRATFRVIREKAHQTRTIVASRKGTAIIGAGFSGAALCHEIQARRGLGMNVVAFFDDDPRKHGTQVHGINVYGAPERLPGLKEELGLQKAIIAMPSASSKRVREVFCILNQHGLENDILPSMSEILEKRVTVSRLRQVELQDLLGRKQVHLETDAIRETLQGSTVMITGGGGSIGTELCRQVAANFPALLVVIERSEFAAFQIEQELRSQFPELALDVQVADVRDEARLRGVLDSRRPSIVFHAAAHKHVPMMERQGAEAIMNNTLATAKLARWCADAGTSLFLLISTDKAINPTSLMGASKRLAELGLQALQQEFAGRIRFAAVRFGNVLGSSGSVIPIFKKQIAEGGPVTVTHPEVTRYFMTVHEAAGLVIQSATLCEGGEIFVLDMGEQMKVSDMARQMIALSGLRPGEDIEIRYIGLRPGEKLFEELWHNGERLEQTRHPKIRALVSAPPSSTLLKAQFQEIEGNLPRMHEAELKAWIQLFVPEYGPSPSQSL